MNMYSFGGVTPVAADVPSSTSVTPINAALPTVWAAVGCYTDDVGAHTLSHGLNIAFTTIDKCIASCAAAGYSIAGVEYGGECYCDTIIQNNQGLASDGAVGCNMACAGIMIPLIQQPGMLTWPFR